MNQYGIAHPALLPHLQPNFYPSLCTIAIADTIQDEFGEEMGTLTPVAGMINIPSRLAPRGSTELRSAQQIYAQATHHLALNGYYPGIDTEMSAQVDGVTYDIEGVEHDGNDEMTRLYLREVI